MKQIFQVLNEFKSEYIFSAHDHTSFNFISDFKTKKLVFVQRLDRSTRSEMYDAQWRFGEQSPNLVSEIIVPTCSYRMGSNYMGYGVLTIGNIFKDVAYMFDIKVIIIFFNFTILPLIQFSSNFKYNSEILKYLLAVLIISII